MPKRYANNPIFTPASIAPSRADFEVIGVFNAGAIQYGEEILLLLRVAERPLQNDPEHYLAPVYDVEKDEIVIEKLAFNHKANSFADVRVIKLESGARTTSISHFRIARSKDGYHFEAEAKPVIAPSSRYETFGIEDPRITQIGDNYYINYSAISELGITTMLAVTKDFASCDKLGNIFHPDNKDVTIFPKKINGLFYALHRPSISHFATPDIWIAQSPDLLHWGNHMHIAGVRQEGWDTTRVGASAVPFLTEHGWLEIYHGADENNRYCLGALLLDAERPWVVKRRSIRPILEPETTYEIDGFFGNVVFACGAVRTGNEILIYYGAADTSIAAAMLTIDEIMASFQEQI